MPTSRRIAILFAVPPEMQPLARRLSRCASPAPRLPGVPYALRACGDREVLLVCGGVGRKRAERAAEEILTAWQPEILVMAGVGGALAPGLGIGNVVVAESVLTEGDALAPEVLFPPEDPASHRGALLSLDRVLGTPAEKRQEYERIRPESAPPPLAIEMETAGMVAAARRHGVAWGAVRAVSDTADEGLPLDFNALRDTEGDLPLARIAWAAVTHPGSIPGLLRLGRNTDAAAQNLATYLHAWITQLATAG